MKTVRQLLAAKGNAVHTVSPEATVYRALEKMAEHDVGALVVLDDDGNVVGLMSERDYARKVILVGRASRDMSVAEIMSPEPRTVTSSQDVQACMEIMTSSRFRHLPVVENGQLSGIISIGDVVKAIMEEQRSTIEELETYITKGG
jgi:CBS domain-containing protein